MKSTTVNSMVHLLIAIGLILLAPLVAMQFSDSVNWTLFDFVVAGGLLLGAGLIYQLTTKRTHDTRRKAIVGTIVLAALMVVWAQLAVGIFN